MTEEIKQVDFNRACAVVGVPSSYAHRGLFLEFSGQESRFKYPYHPLQERMLFVQTLKPREAHRGPLKEKDGVR